MGNTSINVMEHTEPVDTSAVVEKGLDWAHETDEDEDYENTHNMLLTHQEMVSISFCSQIIL